MIAWLIGAALATEVQRYAVVVGTNEGLATDEVLEYAELDAERVATVLEDLGDFHSEDIVMLRRVDAPRLRRALSDLEARLTRRRGSADTLLFFYYSGHADASALHLTGTELPLDELTGLLSELSVDVRVLVVDACQSGELTRLKGATPAEPFQIHAEDRLDSEGMAIITSSSAGEDAQESDRLRGGMFTHHFVAGLMGAADASGDQRVTLNEAHQYSYTETIRATSRARFVQHPSYAFQLRGQSDVVLTRLDDPGTNGVLSLSEPGAWLVFSDRGAGPLVTEVKVDENTLLLLPPGEYLVRLRDPRGIWERTVDVARGETLELHDGDLSAVSYGATVRKGLAPHGHSAVALSLGGGVLGPPTQGLGLGPAGRIGVLLDLEPMTVALGLIGSHHAADNDQLRLRLARVGGDVAGVKKLDLVGLALGLGLRAGGDANLQWFETPGIAPPRRGLTGRVGPMVSLDVPLGSPRSLALLSAGADIQLYDHHDPQTGTSALATTVVPSLSLELARYVR